ncbi:MAG: hypothetical protein D6742_03095 [Cyanobacteria bacterium J069]|nr:MAG: hypothetical protein D6742_03095 [Cyanobacteria bacterium J069]
MAFIAFALTFGAIYWVIYYRQTKVNSTQSNLMFPTFGSLSEKHLGNSQNLRQSGSLKNLGLSLQDFSLKAQQVIT